MSPAAKQAHPQRSPETLHKPAHKYRYVDMSSQDSLSLDFHKQPLAPAARFEHLPKYDTNISARRKSRHLYDYTSRILTWTEHSFFQSFDLCPHLSEHGVSAAQSSPSRLVRRDGMDVL
jgi:hypothetical protein